MVPHWWRSTSCSISFVYSVSSSSSIDADLLLCSSLWPNKYNGLRWYLLDYRVLDGEKSFFYLHLASYSCSQPLTIVTCKNIFNYELWSLAGCKYKGNWHCDQAHIGGNKPDCIFPDVDFCNGRSYLYYHPVKLSKHGN